MFFKRNKSSIILFTLCLLASCTSIFIGVIDLSIEHIVSLDVESIELLLISRLPRLIACLLSGMSLAIAGLIMQALCNNKFVSPTTSATLSSAEFGILFALLFLGQTTLLERATFSFIFAMLGTTLFVSFVLKVQFKDVVMIPLIGIMLSNIISGVTTFIAFDNNMTQALESVTVGHFSSILKGNYEIIYLTLPLFVVTLFYANKLNIVSLGKDFSQNLGLNYKLTLFIGLLLSAALCASIVVVAGSISYVGLIIPNLISIYKGDNLENTLTDTALAGALYVLVCDIISRLIVYPYEISVNIISGVIGSIVFIALIFRKLNEHKTSKIRTFFKNKKSLKV